MSVITLFGPPEPEDKKVVGTATAINYFPKLNLQGRLLWEQRPGLTEIPLTGAPYRCSPQSYAWESPDGEPMTQWTVSNYLLTASDICLDPLAAGIPRVIEYTLPAMLTGRTIGLTYRNETNSRVRLKVYDGDDILIYDELLPATVAFVTTTITGIIEIKRIQLISELAT